MFLHGDLNGRGKITEITKNMYDMELIGEGYGWIKLIMTSRLDVKASMSASFSYC